MADSNELQNTSPAPVSQRSSILEYRKEIATMEQKTQEEYDKTIITLSGGALGVSFAFLKDVLGAGTINLPSMLMASWICWGLSVTSVIISYYLSQLALRAIIKLVDQCLVSCNFDPLYNSKPGGEYSTATSILNIVGGILFFAGVISIAIFVYYNLELIHAESPKPAAQ
jgi:hypothetical protein